MSVTASGTTNVREQEYGTYAPRGEKCPDCNQAIKSLEPCYRISQERVSGPPAVRYRHAVCPGEAASARAPR